MHWGWNQLQHILLHEEKQRSVCVCLSSLRTFYYFKNFQKSMPKKLITLVFSRKGWMAGRQKGQGLFTGYIFVPSEF